MIYVCGGLKDLRTQRNLNPGYLALEPEIVENWPNKGEYI